MTPPVHPVGLTPVPVWSARAGILGTGLVLALLVVRAVRLTRRRAVVHHLVRARDDDAGQRANAVDLLLAGVPAAPAWVVRRLRRAGLAVGAADRTWRGGAVVGGTALWIAAVVGGPGVAALLAFVLLLALGLAAVVVGDRATSLVDRELPAVLATIAAGVRSGASLVVAVGEAAGRARGPAGEDLAEVVEALAAGQPFVEVVGRWVRSRPTTGVRMAGAALVLAAETGGAGARTIDGVAATLRDRVAVDRELAALSSQARASAVVIGLAPIAFVALTAVADPGVWDFFLRSPAGLACLASGCLLDAVGAGWMVLVARSAR